MATLTTIYTSSRRSHAWIGGREGGHVTHQLSPYHVRYIRVRVSRIWQQYQRRNVARRHVMPRCLASMV